MSSPYDAAIDDLEKRIAWLRAVMETLQQLRGAPRANARPDATSSADESHNDKERKE